jgi:hypothetical protein
MPAKRKEQAMYQQPASVWNMVAVNAPAATQTFGRLFGMDQPDLDAALESLASRLERVEKDPAVLRAWMTVAPLLFENVAISQACKALDSQALRQALPEVTTVNEAVALASQEFMLDRSQASKLHDLLTMPLPAPNA